MPFVGFESTTLTFQRAKTVHALGRSATVIGRAAGTHSIIKQSDVNHASVKFSLC
jgi:hypothetical protein